jgi:transcription-repair coupling factor (superfamily II helicase)
MVTLAQSSPSCRSARAPQSKNATVMLGLVVIDEEQHFGAAEKSKLSSLAKGVHMLWMSATPIPRTLAAGLAGFRDLSVIATPPVHRLPIVTKIAPLSDAAIAAALLREQRRNGHPPDDLEV